jgi:hypothetical protein
VRVSWKRDRITIRPRSGFKPGLIYQLELLPVITDLRTNRMRAGRTIVFSTGPAIPESRLEGSVVDWVGGRPAVRALVEATLMPDSLVYRTLTDSGGVFQLHNLPAGHYRVYGVIDQNNDRRRGLRELFDSAGVDLDTAATPLELYAFAHDTVGARVRQVEYVDSITIKLTFDRPLDPAFVLDTSNLVVATLNDSTTPLPITGVFTQKGLDSARTLADSLSRMAADSTRRAADTTRTAADSARPARPARPDTTRRAPADTSRGAQPAMRRGRAPLDSTRADRMLARHPAPTDVRIVRLATPMIPDTRYVIFVTGARSLSRVPHDSRGQVRAPKPRPAAAGGHPASPPRPDSTARDTTTTPVPADTTRPAPPRRP